MQDLMRYEEVVELLAMDVRDERRNRLFLSAVSEKISLFLKRNLILDSVTTTEWHETVERKFVPNEYPVREILEIVDSQTGEILTLAEGCELKTILNADAHREHFLKIAGKKDRDIRIKYRYGYTQDEIPALLKTILLDMMRDRLLCTGTVTLEDIESMDKDRMMQLRPYQRIYER